jgi:hypothetical protein
MNILSICGLRNSNIFSSMSNQGFFFYVSNQAISTEAASINVVTRITNSGASWNFEINKKLCGCMRNFWLQIKKID